MTERIGIAGGGLIGRVLAWQLSKAGKQVTVFDRDEMAAGSAAGFTAAGMLTPYAEVETAEYLVYELGMRSLQIWPQWISELSGSVRYNQRGSLVLAHANDLADLKQFSSQVHSKLEPSSEQFLELDRSEVLELEPELSESFQSGVYLPEEAWVSAQDSMQTLGEDAVKLGADWREHQEVTSVAAGEIVVNGQTHQFDSVIDARGTGAKPQWSEVRGVRGEIVRLYAPEVKISRLVRLMHPRYCLYLVPTMQNDEYIVGATQIESEDYSDISVRSALEILSAAYSLHPGFAEARILETKTNCRPALVDNLPKVEISDSLIRVNGLFRHGYLLAPAISEKILNWFESPERSSQTNLLKDRLCETA